MGGSHGDRAWLVFIRRRSVVVSLSTSHGSQSKLRPPEGKPFTFPNHPDRGTWLEVHSNNDLLYVTRPPRRRRKFLSPRFAPGLHSDMTLNLSTTHGPEVSKAIDLETFPPAALRTRSSQKGSLRQAFERSPRRRWTSKARHHGQRDRPAADEGAIIPRLKKDPTLRRGSLKEITTSTSR